MFGAAVLSDFLSHLKLCVFVAYLFVYVVQFVLRCLATIRCYFCTEVFNGKAQNFNFVYMCILCTYNFYIKILALMLSCYLSLLIDEYTVGPSVRLKNKLLL